MARRFPCRPRLETLEDRRVLSHTLATALDIGTLLGHDARNGSLGNGVNDFFAKFTLETAGQLAVTLTGLANTRIDLSLIQDANSNGNIDNGEVLQSTSNPATEGFFRTEAFRSDRPAGTYFVHVQLIGTARPSGFHLEVMADYAGNSLGQARDIGTVGSTARTFHDYVGSFLIIASGPVAGIESVQFDLDDSYKFTPAGPGPWAFFATLHAPGADIDLDLALVRDANNNGRADPGETLQTLTNIGPDPQTLVATLDSTGPFYVRVLRDLVNAADTNYTLTLSVASRDTTGNTLGTAKNLGTLAGRQTFSEFVGAVDGVDFYRFTLSDPATLTAALGGLGASASLRIIRDGDNAVVGGGLFPSFSPASPVSLAAGTYYVSVSPFLVGADTDYTLTLTTDYAGNTPAAGTARTLVLPPGVARDFVGPDDANDFYRFTAPVPGLFSATLSGLSADANLQLIRDANGNGAIDSGEVLTGSSTLGTANESVSTFALPAAGDYVVRVFRVGGETHYDLRLTTTFGSISGTVFQDANADGAQSGTEGGLAGVTVFVDTDNNGRLDSGEPSAVTNSLGAYRLTPLGPGSYTVRAVRPTRFLTPLALPPGDTYTVSLAAGQSVTGKDFGEIPPAKIVGVVFDDFDNDGFKGAGEPGHAGVTVLLDATINGVPRTVVQTVADANGVYTFSGLRPGPYTVRLRPPAGADVGLPAGGFEAPIIGAGAFLYGPAGSPWAFSGLSGISGNGSGFTAGNPNAPEGVQVGFLQQTGSFRQTLNLAAGTYTLAFKAAQRGNFGASAQTFRVLVDGSAVGTFTPAGVAYTDFTTAAFPVATGAHTLTFEGLNPNGGDNTAFLDRVQLLPRFAITTPAAGTAGVTAVGGDDAAGASFGLSDWGTFTGTVVNDVGGDSSGAGDPPLRTVTVFLDLNNNLTLDADEPRTTTDPQGRYTFPQVTRKSQVFLVAPQGPQGFTETLPATGALTLSPTKGGRTSGDFGLSELVVDNPGPGSPVTSAGWAVRTAPSGTFFGANYLDDGNSNKGTQFASYFKALPATGQYEVFARWPAAASAAGNTPIDINHRDGTTRVPVDQRSSGSTFVSLGRFFFTQASVDPRVVIRNDGTTANVFADAVKFVRLPPKAPSGLAAEVLSPTAVRLTWADNSASEAGFVVQRSTRPDFATFEEFTLSTPDLTASTDTGLAPHATYYYRVLAYGVSGRSDFSNAAAIPPRVQRRLATGADAGGAPHVRVFDARTGQPLFSFLAYDPTFTGGVRVATGDVTGDGTDDVITAAGPGGGPHVKVFDGASGELIREFFAYDPSFAGGVWVAAADFDGDGRAEVVTGAGAGGGPHVEVFDGATGRLLRSFLAYDPAFAGGVRVAAGDVTGDGTPDIVTGAGPGGGPHVKVFDGVSGGLVREFLAYGPAFRGGVFVAALDADGDGRADVVTASGADALPSVPPSDDPRLSLASGLLLTPFPQSTPFVRLSGAPSGEASRVKVFRGTDLGPLADFAPYGADFAGGVRVAAGEQDGRPLLVTAPGPGGGPHVRRLDGPTLVERDSLMAYDPNFLGGVFVG